MPISARLIVNQAALKLKRRRDPAAARRLRRAVAPYRACCMLTAWTPRSRISTRGCAELLAFEAAQDRGIDATVAAILADVKARGDAALLEYTRALRPRDCRRDAQRLEIAQADLRAGARGACPPRNARRWCRRPGACAPITSGRSTQSWSYTDADGNELGQKVTRARPRRRVRARRQGGLSVVGAHERRAGAGRRRARNHHGGADARRRAQSDLVLAAAALCGVDRVFAIGGAQAVGALAYGTRAVPRSTRSSGPATPTSRRRSGACSAWSASTWSPGRPRSS